MALPQLPLPGEHQWDNFATALTAFGALVDIGEPSPRWLQDALRDLRLPGRLQHWAGDRRVILDVGHNPLAAEAVSRYLRQLPGQDSFCVLGMLYDKDVEHVVQILASEVDQWFCAGLESSRGQTGGELAREGEKPCNYG